MLRYEVHLLYRKRNVSEKKARMNCTVVNANRIATQINSVERENEMNVQLRKNLYRGV